MSQSDGGSGEYDPVERSDELGEFIRLSFLDEIPDYEKVTAVLDKMPTTWLLGLLGHTVKLCTQQDVFREGGLVSFVSRVEARIKESMK